MSLTWHIPALALLGGGLLGFLLGSHVCNEAWHRWLHECTNMLNNLTPAAASRGGSLARIPGQGEVAGDARPTFIGFDPFAGDRL